MNTKCYICNKEIPTPSTGVINTFMGNPVCEICADAIIESYEDYNAQSHNSTDINCSFCDRIVTSPELLIKQVTKGGQTIFICSQCVQNNMDILLNHYRKVTDDVRKDIKTSTSMQIPQVIIRKRYYILRVNYHIQGNEVLGYALFNKNSLLAFGKTKKELIHDIGGSFIEPSEFDEMWNAMPDFIMTIW